MEATILLTIIGIGLSGIALLSSLSRLNYFLKLQRRAARATVFVIHESKGIRVIFQSVLEKSGLIYAFATVDEAEQYSRSGVIADLIIVNGLNQEETDRVRQKLLSPYGLTERQLYLLAEGPAFSINPADTVIRVNEILHTVTGENRKSSPSLFPGQLFPKTEVRFSLFRRFGDIFLALVAIFFLLPVLIVISIAIKIDSRGPILYRSVRVGFAYKKLILFKFRTMAINADNRISELAHLNQYTSQSGQAVFFKVSNDPRVTRVGRILRQTSLDMLPALFNVLRGDLSLVGNEALPTYMASMLVDDKYSQRFLAPAGVTGPWQVAMKDKKEDDELSVEQRLNLEINYARKNNFLLDLLIIAGNLSSLIRRSVFQIYPVNRLV
ncbi:MAG: hypothetical protein DI535_00790 [Citrobacter freundii]|nr:MAG: hypothetical protein DI535_00790 [Citrobacter freundii]